jgi:Family of unknown function (DUF6326)
LHMTWETSMGVESEVAQLRRGNLNALSALLMRYQNRLHRYLLRSLQERAFPKEVDMHDTKERLSVLWIFSLLNYLYADVIALFAIAGSRNSFEPLPPWALMGSAVLMEIPIAMILACRLLPFRANRLANIITGGIVTLVNGFLTFVPPLAGWGRPPAFPEYLFFATIETVATSVIIWQAWTWSRVEAEVSTERIVLQGR